jgi:hypothetical protein
MNPSVRPFRRNVLLACAAAALLGAVAHAADPATEDPAAIAASYEKQAAELRASADKHDNMAKMHRGGAGSSKMNHDSVVQHCKKLSESLRAAAAESDALAAEFRKAAQK